MQLDFEKIILIFLRKMINNIWRNCTKCWEFKEWDNFFKNKRTSSWYKEDCKVCAGKIAKLKYVSPRNILDTNTRWDNELYK